MNTFNRMVLPVAGLLFAGCNLTPGAIVGNDQAAEEATTYARSNQPCNLIAETTRTGTGDCSMPNVTGVMTTRGDHGDLILHFNQLSDGNYPLVQSLKFEAKEKETISGSDYEATYAIVFTCTAESDTPQHLRPFHCVAQSAPRLRSTEQPGGGTVKFSELVVENPTCHSTVKYTTYATYCSDGEEVRRNPFKMPVLGLVKP